RRWCRRRGRAPPTITTGATGRQARRPLWGRNAPKPPLPRDQERLMSDPLQLDALSCPLPRTDHQHVLLGHGSGGRLTADLIRRLFLPGFGGGVLAALEDQATVPLPGCRGQRLAFTTDSFVVSPLFFPGGDIGRLAVHGTVNDLAVGGATPLYLGAAF